ncbi:hypothetical protein ASZ90_011292 [hydrocarbon metagenome]|uniref:Uncharacterized protein n=1 Tax=hydrocarbon metagenome TaxID=938273 RepID=A0A0W8FFF2_9ZZZZ
MNPSAPASGTSAAVEIEIVIPYPIDSHRNNYEAGICLKLNQ